MEDGKELYITDNHQVLNGQNKWTKSGDLQEKTGTIKTLKNLSINEGNSNIILHNNKIKSIEKLEGIFTVYNLATEAKTYIANGVAVHNCFVQQKPHYMTLDVAKDAVHYLIKNYEYQLENNYIKENEKITITFFGGEPTLMWDEIIVPLVEYVDEIGWKDKIDWSITTNGTLLSPERIEWLRNNSVFLLLSCDGPAHVQDFNRPKHNGEGSLKDIEKNIPYLLEAFPELTFRATVDQNTAKYIFDTVLYADLMGFSNIFLCPNTREEWTEKHLEEIKQAIKDITLFVAWQFLEEKTPIEVIQISRALLRIVRLDLNSYYNITPIRKYSRDCTRCGIGVSSISINYKGDIFACQEQDSRDTSDPFLIGNIYNGINKQKHLSLINEYIQEVEIVCTNPKICETCKIKPLCIDDICPSSAKDTTGSFFIKEKGDCLIENYWLEATAEMMKILVEKNSITYKNYFDNLIKQA